MTRKLQGICHTDVPSREASDDGESIRNAAAATCGALVAGRDAFQVHDEIERTGGPEKQLDRILKKRGDDR